MRATYVQTLFRISAPELLFGKDPRVVKKSQKKTVKIVMRYFSNTKLGGTTKSIRPIADYAIGFFVCRIFKWRTQYSIDSQKQTLRKQLREISQKFARSLSLLCPDSGRRLGWGTDKVAVRQSRARVKLCWCLPRI